MTIGMVPIWSLVKLKINKSGRPQNVRLLNEQNYKKKKYKKSGLRLNVFIKQNRELGEMNILIWIICVILNWMSVQSESDLKSKASFHTKIA